LFDDEGRVIGVNTFVIRKGSGRDMALEALNFALESDFIHEILTDPNGKSLDAKAIAAVLNPPETERPQALIADFKAKVQRFERAGYRHVVQGNKVIHLAAGQQQIVPLRYRRAGECAIAAVSRGADDIDLALYDRAGSLIASDTRFNSDPEMAFRLDAGGFYSLVVINPSNTDAVVVVIILEK
jgi:hypothetical protein